MLTATRQLAAEPSGADVPTAADVAIHDLGPCRIPSPLADRLGERAMHYVGEADKVLIDDRLSSLGTNRRLIAEMPAFELAGPRNRIFFEPSFIRCGIVTCGGLCPGLNNVVRGLVWELMQGYGVREVIGFRYGYEGLSRRYGHRSMPLDLDVVADVHRLGGTVLGTSRGMQVPEDMVDQLVAERIDILFVIGGDGTMRGALALVAEIERRKLRIAVVGVPKTIDNDIEFIDRSFGFETAFSAAVDAIHSAHTEARGARDGIGLVKLMGRHSGFIACQAALAAGDVSAVAIPEVPLRLDGERGLLEFIARRLDRRGHVVVVIAEGAAEHLFPDEGGRDASGNARLRDVGVAVRDAIIETFGGRRRSVNLKYIDPSYHIRSVPASPSDSVYCWHMARNAVHAAMAGNTGMLIGRWHGRFVHVPMALATRGRKRVDPTGDLWMSVIESTGQPVSFS
jgi:6-phosphofructokinase 1